MSSGLVMHRPALAGFGFFDRVTVAGPAVGASLLGLLVFVNESNFRAGNAESLSIDWQIGMRIVIGLLCGAYGLLHFREVSVQWQRFPLAWCLLFAGWVGISVPFAVNFIYAGGALVLFLSMLLFVPAVLLQLGGANTARVVLSSLILYVLGSWVVYLVFPDLGETRATYGEVVVRLGGLNHANNTGLVCAIAISLSIVLASARQIRWSTLAVLLPLFAITLIYSGSRTAMLTAATGVVMCLWYIRPIYAVSLGLLLALLLAILLAYSGDQKVTALLTRSGDANEIYTMTGRSQIWLHVVDLVRESPLVGYGFNCSRFVMSDYSYSIDEHADLYHAHNLVLNVALGIGIPGALLVLAMMFQMGIALIRQPSILPDVLFAMFVVNGLSEVVLFVPFASACNVLWIVALLWRQAGASLQDGSACVSMENH